MVSSLPKEHPTAVFVSSRHDLRAVVCCFMSHSSSCHTYVQGQHGQFWFLPLKQCSVNLYNTPGMCVQCQLHKVPIPSCIENLLDPISPQVNVSGNTIADSDAVRMITNHGHNHASAGRCQETVTQRKPTQDLDPPHQMSSAYAPGRRLLIGQINPEMQRARRCRKRPDFMSALGTLQKDMKLPNLDRTSALLKFIQTHINQNKDLCVDHMQCFLRIMSGCSNVIRVCTPQPNCLWHCIMPLTENFQSRRAGLLESSLS